MKKNGWEDEISVQKRTPGKWNHLTHEEIHRAMLKLALLPQVTFHPHNFVYTSQIPTSKFLLFLLTFSSPGLECSSHSPHQTLNHHLKTSPSPTSGRISWPLLSLRSPKTLSLPNHHAFSHFPICMTDVLKS